MPTLFQFDQKTYEEYKASVLPFAVYQYVDDEFHLLVVSDGLCKMAKLPREKFEVHLNEYMYRKVHPQDVYLAMQAAIRFAAEGSEYDVVYREKLGDDDFYSTIHAVGEHVLAPDGSRLDIIRYDNITNAERTLSHVWNPEETEELDKDLKEQKYINDHIDEAIANGEIKVYYQPVVRTLNCKLCGYEALARWISPEIGFLPPYRFIPALEASRQIYKLDCFMIEDVCRQYREDTDAGKETVPVSFNLSRIDFEMCDIFTFIQNAAAKYRVPHSFLHIEITETTFSEDEGEIKETIRKFHEEGYEVWMDDFGSGYSSLNSLKDYRFDQLKLDMEFLRSFTDRSKEIIRSIVHMAKRIGIYTLAEGVETEEHYEFLRSIGCDKVQGYYFGKPLPLAESFAQVQEKNIGPETTEDAVYYSKAGIKLVATEEPFAVIEFDGSKANYLYMNQDYITVLKNVGFESVQEAISVLNSEEIMLRGKYKERIMQATQDGGELHFALPIRGHYLTVAIKIFIQEGNRICYKQTLSNTIIDVQVKEQIEEEQKETVEDKKKKTILIVDDEPINYILLNEILKAQYNILYAQNGEKGLQMLREARRDVAAVLLDMVMPVMDGMQVLREIRKDEYTRFLPVLVMTSATDMQEDVLREEASAFLPKPFEMPEIILAKLKNEIAKNQKMQWYSFNSMENLPGGIFIYKADEDETLLYANKKTLEIFECDTFEDLVELTGGSFKGLVHEADLEAVEESILRQIQENDNKKDHVKYRIRTKSGVIKTIDEIGQLSNDAVLGEVYYVFITESIVEMEYYL